MQLGTRGKLPALAVVLVLGVLVSGCSAVIPPDAQGQVWENVIQGERANAARGYWGGVGIILFGLFMMVSPIFPDLDVMAKVGIPYISFLGVTVRSSVPAGLVVVLLGILLIIRTQFNVEVSTGEPEGKRRKGRKKKGK